MNRHWAKPYPDCTRKILRFAQNDNPKGSSFCKIREYRPACEKGINKESARAEIRRSGNGSPPPVLDPFCGGGSIPLEAQRLGLEAHAFPVREQSHSSSAPQPTVLQGT